MKPVRIAVVGAGVIGRMHVARAAEMDHVHIEAIADLNAEAAQKVAEEFSVAKVYPSLDEVLADDAVQGVVLALPTGVRFEPAMQCLQAGKHVLLEKPPAMNGGQIKQLMAARGDLVVAGCSSRHAFNPAVAKTRELIEQGILGKLRVIRCRAVHPSGPDPENPPPVWRLRYDLNGGGIMANWGVYDLDFLLSAVGYAINPQKVLAQTWQIGEPFSAHAAPGSDAETHLNALITCADGIVLDMERAERAATEATVNEWQIIGETGSVQLNLMGSETNQLLLTTPCQEKGTKTEVVMENNIDFTVFHAGPISDFATAIATGSKPHTGLEESLLIQQIIDGIYTSARSGDAVDFARLS